MPGAFAKKQQTPQNLSGFAGFALDGAEGDRTPDLVTASHALSQLSYGPVWDVPATSPTGSMYMDSGLCCQQNL